MFGGLQDGMLSHDAISPPRAEGVPSPRSLDVADAPDYELWSGQWQSRLSRESVVPSHRAQAMRRVNPAFIPRNHRVEEALSAAVERADYAPFERLLKVLALPFDDKPEFAAFAEPAPHGKGRYRTFCGT